MVGFHSKPLCFFCGSSFADRFSSSARAGQFTPAVPPDVMHGPHFQHSMNQPGKVADLTRGQLKNRENVFSPAVPVRACEFGLARQDQPSIAASAR